MVTLADSNYFPLLEELIHSIRKFKQSEKIDICEFQSTYRPSSVCRKQMAEFNLGNVSG